MRSDRAAAEKALALDPTLGDANSSLGIVLVNVDHDWRGSAARLTHACTLDPGKPDTADRDGRRQAVLGGR